MGNRKESRHKRSDITTTEKKICLLYCPLYFFFSAFSCCLFFHQPAKHNTRFWNSSSLFHRFKVGRFISERAKYNLLWFNTSNDRFFAFQQSFILSCFPLLLRTFSHWVELWAGAVYKQATHTTRAIINESWMCVTARVEGGNRSCVHNKLN